MAQGCGKCWFPEGGVMEIRADGGVQGWRRPFSPFVVCVGGGRVAVCTVSSYTKSQFSFDAMVTCREGEFEGFEECSVGSLKCYIVGANNVGVIRQCARLTLRRVSGSKVVGPRVLYDKSLKRMMTSSMCYIPSGGDVRVALEGSGGREEFVVDTVGGSGRSGVGKSSVTLYLVSPATIITFSSAPPLEEPSHPTSAPKLPTPPAPPNPYESPHLRISRQLQAFYSSSILPTNPSPPLPRCIILTGPPGVGKTYSINLAVSHFQTQCGGEGTTNVGFNVNVVPVKGSDVIYNSSETDKPIKDLLAALFKPSKKHDITLVFIDEADALLSHSVLVTDLMGNFLDELSTTPNPIFLVMATNHIDHIPKALRRPGRIDEEVFIAPPGVEGRVHILKRVLSTPVDDGELFLLAQKCVGFVAADLALLVKKAEREGGGVSMQTLHEALATTPPSALRESVLSKPTGVGWESVGGDAGGAKSELQRAVEWPILKRDEFKKFNLKPPRGILLYGPPGCAKTTLAKACANAANVAFMTLTPADVYAAPYVGDAEAVIRRAFKTARVGRPCVLFFDEIDSIVGGSVDNNEGGGTGMGGRGDGKGPEARVMSTFLNEMDGVDIAGDDGVLVLGATNRPNVLDAALLRAGRFDKLIYVGPPDHEGRKVVFNIHGKGIDGIGEGGELMEKLASITEGFTGAEIEGVCRTVKTELLFEEIEGEGGGGGGCLERFLRAVRGVKPITKDIEKTKEYEIFRKR